MPLNSAAASVERRSLETLFSVCLFGGGGGGGGSRGEHKVFSFDKKTEE